MTLFRRKRPGMRNWTPAIEHVNVQVHRAVLFFLATNSAMFNLYSIFLYIIHRIYAIYLALNTLWKWRQEQRTAAQPLVTPRHRLPKHLAVIFTASPNFSKESATSVIVQSVVNVVQWCRQLGVTKLTVYEEHGSASHFAQTSLSDLFFRYLDGMRT